MQKKKAVELGYNVVNFSPTDLSNIQNVDGVLAIGKFTKEKIDELNELAANLCVIGTNFPLSEYDCINTDFTQATEIAINHLLELGHKKNCIYWSRRKSKSSWLLSVQDAYYPHLLKYDETLWLI